MGCGTHDDVGLCDALLRLAPLAMSFHAYQDTLGATCGEGATRVLTI